MSTVVNERRPWRDQGKNLQRARKRLGISQERFAPMVGTTRRHLIRLENGEHRPSSELLGRIAAETGEQSKSFGYPPDDEEDESELASDLLRALRALIRAEREEVA